ncbi:MAG: hypothetical protein IJT51_04695 [Bacteroidales bacterium]|nr:hypothetical protein [Bacteroidales bacterium]
MQTENKGIYVSRNDIKGLKGEIVFSKREGCAYIGDGEVIFVAHANHIYKADFRNTNEEMLTATTTFTLDTPDEVEWYNKLQKYVCQHGTLYHETIIIEKDDERFKDNGYILLCDEMGYSIGRDLDAEVKQLYENMHAIEDLRSSGAVDAMGAPNGENLNFSLNEEALSAKIKYLRERLERGGDDTETWNLDVTVAKFILPRLKRFKEVNNGYPCELTPEGWDQVIEKMIYAFEHSEYEDLDYDGKSWLELHEAEKKEILCKITEGLNLFARHFFDLCW